MKTALSVILTFAASSVRADNTFPAAPPNPPIIVNTAPAEPRLAPLAASVYTIGDPTPEEQLYLELINRARANPAAEAQFLAGLTDPDVLGSVDFFNTDLQMMVEQFGVYTPAQPLAMNALLTSAARRHSRDMLDNAFLDHTGTDGSTPATRVRDTGYNYFTVGENVFPQSRSVIHGHAGFQIDWGFGTGGMQTPPGHRNTIHSPAFREIGVGVLFGSNTRNGFTSGPQVVSQEFAAAQGATPFITGVVYYDLNGNNFYDVNEGIGGVSVKVNGVAREGITALSGGYAVPVPGNGSYSVTFSGNGFTPQTRTVTVAGQLNQKLDLLPIYVPPVVSGPSAPAVGRANNYTFSAVPGASAYQFRNAALSTAQAEPAENTSRVAVSQTAGYNVVQTALKTSGNASFHLVHPQSGPVAQSITLNPTYLLSANSSIAFQSRLGWASPAQTAALQISTNGSTWLNVYTQAGTGDAGERVFTRRTVSLSQFAGHQARFRFIYSLAPGMNYFPQTDPEVGWSIDDIQFTASEELAEEQISTAQAGSFQFTPSAASKYLLQARAKTGHEFLAWGPATAVNAAVSNAPELQLSRLVVGRTDLQLTVDLLAGTAGTLSVETKTRLGDAWAPQSANVETVSSSRYLLRIPISGSPARFFRVRSN